MHRGLIALLAALVLLVAAPTASAAAPTRAERALLAAVNETRRAHGLRPVRFSWPLQDRAHAYAVRLLRTDSFQHEGLAPGVRENLGWATTNMTGLRGFVRMWLDSPAHRRTLLWRDARFAGVGVARGEYRGYPDVRVAVLRLR